MAKVEGSSPFIRPRETAADRPAGPRLSSCPRGFQDVNQRARRLSPNAAFSQTTYQMTAAHTYVFKLKWKTNKNAPGATIFAAAGHSPTFSPTRLTVDLTN